MTDRYDDEYDGLCPDDRHDEFEKGARLIVDLASGLSGTLQTLPPPSKIKRELEQLRGVLSKLSADAQSTLWSWGAEGHWYSPTSDLLERIDLAVHRVSPGRPRHDEARRFLGVRAASLWTTHDGDIRASEFITFLQGLIEAAGFGGGPLGGGKVRIDSATLAEEMREEYARCAPPRWDRY
jgi:hypothetical protein